MLRMLVLFRTSTAEIGRHGLPSVQFVTAAKVCV